jgi:protein gp37
MSEATHIQWTNATWNPWHGCRKVSAGCKNCYMFSEKRRYGQEPTLVVRSKTKFRDPLKWKDPAMVFTCSWSDWFIEEADAWRDEAWDIVRSTPHLTYQILTKRPERITDHLPSDWPLRNVWLGVSVEDQANADKRIPELLRIPAAVRFLSVEPLLEPVDLQHIRWPKPDPKRLLVPVMGDVSEYDALTGDFIRGRFGMSGGNRIDWVIVGGESGPGARPCNVEWIRSIVAQCKAANVPVFCKQLGTVPMEPEEHWRGRVVTRLLSAKNRDRVPNGFVPLAMSDPKGGDITEFPLELRVREFPEVAA